MADPFAAADPVVSVDGQRVPELARDCLALEVQEDTDGLRTCIGHFVANAPRGTPSADVVEYLDGRPLDFGRSLSVSVGPPGDERVVFAGTISALEVVFDEGDAPHVSVYAEDALMRLRESRRSATYTEVSDADLVRRVAAEHGLSAQVDADLAFLRGRARRIGAELWAAGSTVHLATRDRRQGPTVALARGRTLLSVSVRADLAGQRSTVAVSGFDAQQRARIDVTADSGVVAAETSGGRSGADVSGTTGGPRSDQRAVLSPLTTAEARAWAEADLRARARRFVTAVGVAVGAPQLAVGARVTLAEVGAPFNGGGYYVTHARHVFARDMGGLRTHFRAERPTVNAAGGGGG
jgi:phage protein D